MRLNIVKFSIIFEQFYCMNTIRLSWISLFGKIIHITKLIPPLKWGHVGRTAFSKVEYFAELLHPLKGFFDQSRISFLWEGIWLLFIFKFVRCANGNIEWAFRLDIKRLSGRWVNEHLSYMYVDPIFIISLHDKNLFKRHDPSPLPIFLNMSFKGRSFSHLENELQLDKTLLNSKNLKKSSGRVWPRYQPQ